MNNNKVYRYYIEQQAALRKTGSTPIHRTNSKDCDWIEFYCNPDNFEVIHPYVKTPL